MSRVSVRELFEHRKNIFIGDTGSVKSIVNLNMASVGDNLTELTGNNDDK